MTCRTLMCVTPKGGLLCSPLRDSPNGSAMAAPKADEDDTETDAQAEEVRV